MSDSNRTLTNESGTFKTAYGSIGMRCNGKNRDVHDFQIKILKMDGDVIIGIDHGRRNMDKDFSAKPTYHYALNSNGYLLEKGILPS